MKSLLTLHQAVLRSAAQQCSTGIELDISYIEHRWKDEGDEFLTITLPRFAKTLERALDAGRWPDHEPLGFKRIGGLPVFMRGFLIRIFQRNGRLLDDPDTDCIWAVRQVCYLSHKVERECSTARMESAFNQFIRTDEELMGLPGRLDQVRLETFQATAHRLFGDMFQKLDARIAAFELIPKHGPGAVAESTNQLGKRNYAYWPERLESVFPHWRYTCNSVYPMSRPALIPIDQEMPVRVISVPKTQATPRIIAIEPSTVQYAQQGLKRELYKEIDHGPLGKVLGFRDQSRNQELARKSSLDQSLATLDLSEASDRIHWFLVRTMLKRYPHLWDYVWASRSHRAKLPTGVVIPLQKFASMGSALTFPIEAIIFTILALCGIEDRRNRRLKVRELPGLLSVYGDDIVVPIDSVGHVVDWLEHFGAKVNRAKSFWNGKFRESCGAEFYDGTDVSVVRLRHELPSSRDDATEIAALVDFRNRAYRAGLWRLVGELDEELKNFIRLPITKVSQEAVEEEDNRFNRIGISYLSQQTFQQSYGPGRHIIYDTDLHRFVWRVPVFRARGVSYTVDGEAGLLEWFQSSLRRGDFVNRYDSQERPTSFSIKRRWSEVPRDFWIS